MSGNGPSRRSLLRIYMSGIGGEADMLWTWRDRRDWPLAPQPLHQEQYPRSPIGSSILGAAEWRIDRDAITNVPQAAAAIPCIGVERTTRSAATIAIWHRPSEAQS